jgi:hypothetical protein
MSAPATLHCIIGCNAVMRERRIRLRYCDRIGTLYLSEALPERKRQGDGLRNAIALAAALKCRGLRIARAGGPRDQDAVASPFELLIGAFAAPALTKRVAN